MVRTSRKARMFGVKLSSIFSITCAGIGKGRRAILPSDCSKISGTFLLILFINN